MFCYFMVTIYTPVFVMGEQALIMKYCIQYMVTTYIPRAVVTPGKTSFDHEVLHTVYGYNLHI